MNEDVRLSISGGSDGQFSMGSMHWVSSLESDDSSPGEFVEVSSEFSRGVCACLSAKLRGDEGEERTSKCYVVEMLRSLDSLDRSTDVEFPNVVVEVGDSRVGLVVRTEDGSSLVRLVGSVDVRDYAQSESVFTPSYRRMSRDGLTGENGESSFVTGISKGDSGAGSEFEGVDLLGGDVESDGHGEEGSVGQSKSVDDAVTE